MATATVRDGAARSPVARARDAAGPWAELLAAARSRDGTLLLALVATYGLLGPGGYVWWLPAPWTAALPAPQAWTARLLVSAALVAACVAFVHVRGIARGGAIGLGRGDGRAGLRLGGALTFALGVSVVLAAACLPGATFGRPLWTCDAPSVARVALACPDAAAPAAVAVPLTDLALFAGAYGAYFAGVEALHHGLVLFGWPEARPGARLLACGLVHLLFHFGTTPAEVILGPVWAVGVGVLVLRCRSIWPAVVAHWLPNVALDVYVWLRARG